MRCTLIIYLTLAVFTHADNWLAESKQRGDWNTYRGNNQRNGSSSETLALPLHQNWIHSSTQPPSPSWPQPASINLATKQLFSNAMFFDYAYHPVIANNLLYYGSSTDDTLYCIDTKDGSMRWSFTTEGPIRIAPTIYKNCIYTGSDDGHIYCLNAATGDLIWKFKGGPKLTELSKSFIGNGRIISRWPIRCGTIIENDTVYFSAGLFPSQGVYLHALNAKDGTVILEEKISSSAQGHMLASEDKLFLPTGRNTPIQAFSKSNGKVIAPYGETSAWGRRIHGGSFATIANDMIISGPTEGRQIHILKLSSPLKTIFTVNEAHQMVTDKTTIYATTGNPEENLLIKAFDLPTIAKNAELEAQTGPIEKRLKDLSKKNKDESLTPEITKLEAKIKALQYQFRSPLKWQSESCKPFTLIKAGDVIFAGGINKITAYSATDGKLLWSSKADGNVFGLAISNGKLYASTDRGEIYCFSGKNKQSIELHNGGTTSVSSEVLSEPDHPVPYTHTAESALNSIDTDKGFCLITGSDNGKLAWEIAKRSQLRIIGIERDIEKVKASRKTLQKTGLYGKQIVIHHITSKKLPYPKYFANLVIASDTSFSKEELSRVLRPEGGVLVSADGKTTKRGPLKGAGEWTHQYAEPGNTACSDETLLNETLDIQWFGRPGPQDMVDRHYKNVSPLYKDGRLFSIGENIIFCIDAYNGTMIWEKEVPGSIRMGAYLNTGSAVVDENNFYIISSNVCKSMDVKTGEEKDVYKLPSNNETSLAWGYIASTDKLLVGSASKKAALFSSYGNGENDFLWNLNQPVVASEHLFAIDKKKNKTKWIYKNNIILNTTITIGDDKVYFIETTNKDAGKTGRIMLKTLTKEFDQYLVALNLSNGKETYRKKLDTSVFTEPIYINYSKNTLLLSGSAPDKNALIYSYYAFDADKGELRWNKSHKAFYGKANDGHGQQNRHPVIIDNIAYAWPNAYNLETGEVLEHWKMDRRGHGCGGVSGSAHHLFWRGGNSWMINVKPGSKAKRITQATRPGCWINIIPAGGMILIPEASSGCACAYSIQTSIGLTPR